MKNSFVKLKDVAKLEWGNTSITKSSYVEVGFPAFSAAGSDGYLNHAEFEDDGIVLSAIGARCGKCFKAYGKWTAIKNTITIIPNKDKVDLNYLFTQLNDDKSWKISGAAQPFITLATVRDRLIQLPPLAEQKRIAALLDTADRILKLRESAIAKLDSLIYSLFNQYFLIGNQWNCVKLIDVANTTSGGTPKRDMQNYYGGDICWVKSGELNCDLITKTEEYLTKDGMNNSSAKLMSEGTVLLAMYGATIGAVSMLGVPATTNQAICCINVNSKLLVPEYLMYFLKFNKNKIINMAVGGAQPNINQNIVRNIEIPIPSMQKQLDFLKILNFIKKKKTLQNKSSKSLTSLKLSLQHQSFAVN